LKSYIEIVEYFHGIVDFVDTRCSEGIDFRIFTVFVVFEGRGAWIDNYTSITMYK
jgi:hypothetical protein